MNNVLYLLNAVALMALVSFNYNTDRVDPAEIHVQASQMVQRPAAQLAVMNSQPGQARLAHVQQQARQTLTEQPVERYTF
jgi:hypothetical protein